MSSISLSKPGAAASSESPANDAELLSRYIRHRDDQAFARLVERYSRLVYATALRLLRDRHAAEDVHQATFLVLARDARQIRQRAMLAAWLHGTALRIAKKSMIRRHRQQALLRSGELFEPATVFDDLRETDRQQALDEELRRLPIQYQAPLVLHYLEGCPYDEVARVLGVSVGTVSGRLQRGKKELQKRLTRRGLGLGTVLTAVSWSQSAAQAAVVQQMSTNAFASASALLQGIPFTQVCTAETLFLAEKGAVAMSTGKVAIVGAAIVLAGAGGWTGGISMGKGPGGGGVLSQTAGVNTVLDPDDVFSPTAGLSAAELATGPMISLADSSAVETQEEKAEPRPESSDPFASGPGASKELEVMAAAAGIYFGREQPSPTQPTYNSRDDSRVPVETGFSPGEKKIDATLRAPTTFDFASVPLDGIVRFLSDRHGIPILFDRLELGEDWEPTDSEVSLVLANVSLGNGLDLLLEPFSLSYVIRNDALTITSEDKAKSTMSTRVYDVRALQLQERDAERLRQVIEFGTGGKWQATQVVVTATSSIRTPVGPVESDDGSIAYFNGVLVVRQNQRTHREIEDLLNSLVKMKVVGEPVASLPASRLSTEIMNRLSSDRSGSP